MTLTQHTDIEPSPDRYGYYRSQDSVDDIYFIEDCRTGEILMGIYFWNEPDTEEGAQAKAKAEAVVQALNMPGCWIDQYHVMESTLNQQRMLVAMWSIEDLQRLRPDLNDDQAWEVLKQVGARQERTRCGITRNSLKRAADRLFPQGPGELIRPTVPA